MEFLFRMPLAGFSPVLPDPGFAQSDHVPGYKLLASQNALSFPDSSTARSGRGKVSVIKINFLPSWIQMGQILDGLTVRRATSITFLSV